MIIAYPEFAGRELREQAVEEHYKSIIRRKREHPEAEENVEDETEFHTCREEIKNYIKQEEIDNAREQRLLVRALKLGFKP
jgi:hypothetical protein